MAPTQRAAEPVPHPTGAHGAAEVVLELVMPDGSVTDISVRAGEEPFASAARIAVVRWQFTPASRDGLPIRARITAKVSSLEPLAPAAAPIGSTAAPVKVNEGTSAEPAPTETAWLVRAPRAGLIAHPALRRREMGPRTRRGLGALAAHGAEPCGAR